MNIEDHYFILAFLFSALDKIQTYFAMIFGRAIEGNPIVAYLFSHYGYFLTTLFLIMLCFAGLFIGRRYKTRIGMYALYCYIGLISLVCVSNLFQMMRSATFS